MTNHPLLVHVADDDLARAVALLAAHGRRREAILFVEHLLRERTSDDDVLLLAALLLGTGIAGDRRRARLYLQRLQCRAAERSRPIRKRD